MGEFIRKAGSVPVTAIRFTGANSTEIFNVFGSEGIVYIHHSHDLPTLELTTVSGAKAICMAGEWVIPETDAPGRFYPCNNEIFEMNYEPYDESQDVSTWADDSVKLEEAVATLGGYSELDIQMSSALYPRVAIKPYTHMITLSVMVDSPEMWRRIWAQFSELVENLGDKHPGMTVSSHQLDVVDDDCPIDELDDGGVHLTHNDQTLDKVRDGLKAAGITGDLLTDCVNQIMNKGILFRERLDND